MKNITVGFTNNKETTADVIILPISESGEFSSRVSSGLSAEIHDNLSCNLGFKGKTGQTLTFMGPIGCHYKKVILVGMGKEKPDAQAFKKAGKPLFEAFKATGYESANIIIQGMKAAISTSHAAALLADSANAASYQFDKYITDGRASASRSMDLTFITKDEKKAQNTFSKLNEVTQGEFLAADMGNEPGNVLYPESAAKLIQKELGALPGVTVTILDAEKMKEERMGAALAVGQGSVNKPCMVVIEYDGTNGQTQGWPVSLVGKGVTFDSGGISLKSGAGMEEMKMDMCGSAAVVGAMRAIAGRGAKTKVVAICGFAENMPDGKSYRPGDIITTRSGQTVNIGNTDAEGRLVLCDALDYIQDKYTPDTVVDLATLTGAVVGALAHTYSGIFTPNDKLHKKLNKAGKKSGQPGWRLPLHEDFARAVKGQITDLNNMSNMRYAGASTAAEFLHNFIKADTKWAHLDIAGTAIPANGIANGHGVRWLNRFIRDNFEENSHKAPTAAPVAKP